MNDDQSRAERHGVPLEVLEAGSGWAMRPLNALKPQPDPVNAPMHYCAHPSGVECITITEHMNFNIGNAVKYLWRAGLKGGALEDLKKARWYIEREIRRIEEP
jgi:hypothetical protein